MNFLWPEMLVLVAVLPLLALLYWWLLRQRKRAVLRHPSLALVKQAVGRSLGWRRHLPPLLLLGALGMLVIAGARPTARLTLPTQQQTVMMVMDVSLSMAATDVTPDRLNAAQVAARSFVEQLPRSTRIGVVAYGGTAHLVQAPTLDRNEVIAAIDRFQLQRGTAIGSGVAVALATLFPEAGIDLGRLATQRRIPRGSVAPLLQDDLAGLSPVPPGSYDTAAIVVLTDGENNAGVDPMDAAQLAASRGVKVFTVGFGSREGVPLRFEGWTVMVRLDEDTLKRVANLTGGQYFHARDGADLQQVYKALQSRLVFETRETEITALFGYAAALLMMLAAGLSVWWYGRIV
jgi:Ca-activated chloride channel homolog